MTRSKKLISRIGIGLLTVFAVYMTFCSMAVAREVTLKAVSGLPSTHFFMKDFGKLVKEINAKGKGIFQINWVGGPEVTPGDKQGKALRRGVFDIVYGPGSYYQGIVPEVNALLGSNITPFEARKNGGIELLDKAWQNRLGAHFLAWPSGSVSYQLFLSVKPKRRADGSLTVGGKKIRGNPTYKAMIDAIGGTMVSIPPSEIQTGLERGLVNGLGFVTVSYAERGWSRFIKYIIKPSVMRISLVMMVNRKKFDSMPKEAQDFLTKMALDHERKTFYTAITEAENERKIAANNGIKTITLEGKARDD